MHLSIKWVAAIAFMAICGAPRTSQALDLLEVFSEREPVGFYVQGNLSGSFSDLYSGGFNTAGPHVNTGSSDDDIAGLGGAIGVIKEFEYFRTRLEVEGMWREDSTHVTNSFPGPPGPITFFYNAQAENKWSVMTNLWFDVPMTDWLLLYGGGGIGASGMRLSANDTVVAGSASDEMFAWQVGTGLIVPVGKRLELDMGYRYFDSGSAEVDLQSIGVGSPAGNYLATMRSHEIMCSIRFKF